jgi:L-ascorbate metabolism protein UlaG (beta-lactamase superfamily)
LWAGVDVAVISHLHWDHLDFGSLRMLADDTLVVVPRGAGSLLRRAGFRRVQELDVGGALEVGAVRIRSTPANHSGFRPPFGPQAQAAGYVVEGSSHVYFAGDTGLFQGMSALGAIDVALLPVGGWGPWLRGGHLDAERAAEAVARIRPVNVLPIHWGTFWPIGLPRGARFTKPATEFARAVQRATTGTRVHVAPIGEKVELVKTSSETFRAARGSVSP